jgi:membrane fusion protein (multidrug efflux system)
MLERSPLAAACVALALAVLSGCESKQQEAPKKAERPPTPVSVVTVVPRTLPVVSTFVAQTESSRQVDIVTRVSGFLDRIAYREGEMVRQGEVMFQLDQKPFQAQLDAARGQLQQEQARFATAEASLNRIKPLAEQNAVPRADLDKATGEYQGAQASVFAAQAKVEEARLNLGYTTIRSPANGLAGQSLQRQGAYLNSVGETAKLTYVAVVDPIWVTFSVSQNQMAKVQEDVNRGVLVLPRSGDFDVEIAMPDGRVYPYRGRINFAEPSFSQQTGTFLVRASLPNPKRELRPGMFVTLRLRGGSRPNAIVVPQLAIQQGVNGHLVFVANEQGTAEVRPVIVGEYEGSADIVVESGLRAGDRVIVDNVQKVVPGGRIAVTAPPAQGAAGSGAPGGPTTPAGAGAAAKGPPGKGEAGKAAGAAAPPPK